MREAFEMLLYQAARVETAAYLGVQPYERSHTRRVLPLTTSLSRSKANWVCWASPCRKRGTSRSITHVRSKVLRSERALRLALIEMYVQSVSIRKLTKITEELCDLDVSSAEVSRAAAALDETLTAWRERELGRCRYVFLDARYENVREGVQVRDLAILLAIGVTATGHREVFGVSASHTEAEVHWRDFMRSLVKRGLASVDLIISDTHEGLKAARSVPRQDMKAEVAAAIRAIFNAPDEPQALLQLEASIEPYKDKAPRLTQWAETAVPKSLAMFCFQESHLRRLRTSNLCERLNDEIRRRTRVATLFPNEASCLRLVSAVVMETSEEWGTDGFTRPSPEYVYRRIRRNLQN